MLNAKFLGWFLNGREREIVSIAIGSLPLLTQENGCAMGCYNKNTFSLKKIMVLRMNNIHLSYYHSLVVFAV